MNMFFLSIANITKNSNSHMKLLFSFFVINAEAVAKTCSVKKVFLEISQKWQENTCVRVYFNKVAGLQLYSNRDSGTGVFLWFLRNF